jgi:hypothetical protein
MRIKILLALAFVASASVAHAQTAQQPRVLCGQDANAFNERVILGRTLLVCADGRVSEALTIDGQLKFVEVEALTADGGRDRIDEAEDEREWRSNGYRPSYCWQEEYRYRRVCRRADLGGTGDCRGLASGRRVDAATCDRWRRELERR